MENASKALIIAGAILLSIIIISLGIMVVNNARNQIGNANLSDTEITTFNSKWQNYEGTSKSYSEVMALVQAVRTHNAVEKDGAKRFVQIALESTSPASSAVTSVPTIPTFPTAMTASKTYKVTLGYSTSGMVVGIAVKANT